MVTTNGRRPGVVRALIRIMVIMGCIELVRFPVLFALFAMAEPGQITGFHVWTYNIASNICPWITVLFALKARRDNGYAALWDRLSRTRVIVKPEGAARPGIDLESPPAAAKGTAEFAGPFQILEEIVPGRWMVAIDPVLQRRVWLLCRKEDGPSAARQQVARRGRLRWLQKVEDAGEVWDAFEATPGTSLSQLVQGDRGVPWGTLRHWLDDLASELMAASKDGTLPKVLSLDHVWITAQGHAILLDEPRPDTPSRAESIAVGHLAGQQRFLAAVAARVDFTRLPLHARGVLSNLKNGKFEKLSFLTGVLRGLVNKPCEVGKWLRAGSIFMLPVYVWILAVVGSNTGAGASEWWRSTEATAVAAVGILVVLRGLFQFLELPFRTTCSHGIFRLAVVDSKGERAGRVTLLRRWAVTWLPLLLPGALVGFLLANGFPSAAFIAGSVVLALWIAAAIHTALHPHRGLHDRLAGTLVVRQ